MPRGPLIILSGPSGSGKTTVIQRLLADPPGPLRLSVSATTRPPRPDEREGVDYYFWTRDHFERELQRGSFLEHAQVHGNYYGTLRREVERFALPTDFPLDESKDTFLRLERRGDKILAAVSQERDKWSYLEAKTVELPAKTLVGLAAVNTSTRVFAPHFDEYRIFREVIEQVPQKQAK